MPIYLTEFLHSEINKVLSYLSKYNILFGCTVYSSIIQLHKFMNHMKFCSHSCLELLIFLSSLHIHTVGKKVFDQIIYAFINETHNVLIECKRFTV